MATAPVPTARPSSSARKGVIPSLDADTRPMSRMNELSSPNSRHPSAAVSDQRSTSSLEAMRARTRLSFSDASVGIGRNITDVSSTGRYPRATSNSSVSGGAIGDTS